MRGIKEERLRELFRVQYNPPRDEYERGFNNCLAMLLTFECKELNPWLPIDNNTPPNRRLLLFYPGLGIHVGERLSDGNFCIEAYDMDTTPTHYQELPDDPKD